MKSVFAFLFFRFGATNGVFFRLSGGDYQFVHPKGQQNICLMYAFKKKTGPWHGICLPQYKKDGKQVKKPLNFLSPYHDVYICSDVVVFPIFATFSFFTSFSIHVHTHNSMRLSKRTEENKRKVIR